MKYLISKTIFSNNSDLLRNKPENNNIIKSISPLSRTFSNEKNSITDDSYFNTNENKKNKILDIKNNIISKKVKEMKDKNKTSKQINVSIPSPNTLLRIILSLI